MQLWFYNEIAVALSTPRLDAYKTIPTDDFETLARYIWNQRLCEAAYPTLETLEVALRNSLHNAATIHFHSPEWFNSGILDKNESIEIAKAKDVLKRERKPNDPGRIIAELGFGFWTSLFASHYDLKFWHHMLKTVFPHMPNRIRTRATVSDRLQRIRRFRNRVFHHERIIHLPQLLIRHAEMLEMITWINPPLCHLLSVTDRFTYTFLNGLIQSREDLRSLPAVKNQ